MNKTINTIFEIVGLLFIVVLIVMFIWWVMEMIFVGGDSSAGLERAELVQKSLEENPRESHYFYINSDLLSSHEENAEPNPPLKITCFTSYECQTPICQSGEIEIGDVALNPKHGYDKLVEIDDQVYDGKWISDCNTDVDIYFGDTYADYQRCKEFGVQYKQVEFIN